MKVTITRHPVCASGEEKIVLPQAKVAETAPILVGDRYRESLEIVTPLSGGVPSLIRHCDPFHTWLNVRLGRKAETLTFLNYRYILEQKAYAIKLFR